MRNDVDCNLWQAEQISLLVLRLMLELLRVRGLCMRVLKNIENTNMSVDECVWVCVCVSDVRLSRTDGLMSNAHITLCIDS